MAEQSVQEVVQQIGEVAPVVGEEHEEHQAAITAEREAEAQVFVQAIEAARPGLRAAASRIQVGERTWWPDRTSPASEGTHDPERRGVCVGGNGPRCDHPSANRGAYKGRDLYLLVDGTLLEARYSGNWSRWQGEGSEWTAVLRPVTPREAMDRWQLADVLSELRDALLSQRGRRTAATGAAKERAERLGALATLAG